MSTETLLLLGAVLYFATKKDTPTQPVMPPGNLAGAPGYQVDSAPPTVPPAVDEWAQRIDAFGRVIESGIAIYDRLSRPYEGQVV